MKILTLSFDDGTVQDRRFVPMLNERGIKATFNLNSGLFGTVHDINHEGIIVCHDEILPDEVRALYAGHEVAVHTVTHPNLLTCDDARVLHEVGDDKRALEALCGYEVVGMAYPGGPFFDDRVISLIKSCGIRYARAVGSTHDFTPPADFMAWYPTAYERDEDLFDLAEAFIAAPDPADSVLLFYVWGHSFEFDKLHNWERFTRFLDRMAHHDDIHYMTNRQAMEACLGKR